MTAEKLIFVGGERVQEEISGGNEQDAGSVQDQDQKTSLLFISSVNTYS